MTTNLKEINPRDTDICFALGLASNASKQEIKNKIGLSLHNIGVYRQNSQQFEYKNINIDDIIQFLEMYKEIIDGKVSQRTRNEVKSTNLLILLHSYYKTCTKYPCTDNLPHHNNNNIIYIVIQRIKIKLPIPPPMKNMKQLPKTPKRRQMPKRSRIAIEVWYKNTRQQFAKLEEQREGSTATSFTASSPSITTNSADINIKKESVSPSISASTPSSSPNAIQITKQITTNKVTTTTKRFSPLRFKRARISKLTLAPTPSQIIKKQSPDILTKLKLKKKKQVNTPHSISKEKKEKKEKHDKHGKKKKKKKSKKDKSKHNDIQIQPPPLSPMSNIPSLPPIISTSLPTTPTIVNPPEITIRGGQYYCTLCGKQQPTLIHKQHAHVITCRESKPCSFVGKGCNRVRFQREAVRLNHEAVCFFNPNNKDKEVKKRPYERHDPSFPCEFCGEKQYKQTKYQNHRRRCYKNPNRAEYMNKNKKKKRKK